MRKGIAQEHGKRRCKIKEGGREMLKICELAVIPLIVLSGGLLESFFEHPILYTAVFFTTMLVCMVLATKE